MGNFLSVVVLGILALVASALSKILADEFKAWRPALVAKIVGLAVSLMPYHERDRYVEEWSAYVDEVPGDLGKLLTATGLIVASLRMTEQKFFTLSMKRLMDILFAASTLFLIMPLLLIVVAMIKIDSEGPIFVARRKMGRDGREFALLALRTTSTLADGRTTRTRLGTLLYRTSISDIPHIFNVLMGDMSLVGPRPLTPYVPEDEKAKERMKIRQKMRPGLTGLEQLRDDGRKDAFIFDLAYISRHSIALDVGILVKSAAAVVKAPRANLEVGAMCAFVGIALVIALFASAALFGSI